MRMGPFPSFLYGVPVTPGGTPIAWATKVWQNTTSPTIDFTTELTFATGITAIRGGDLAIVNVCFTDVASTPDNPSLINVGSWTALHSILFQSDINRSKLGTWMRFMPASPDADVQATNYTGDRSGAMSVIFFRGIDQGSPLDVPVQTAGGTNVGRWNAPAITPVTPGAIIVVSGGSSGSSGAVTSPDMTVQTSGQGGSTAGHCGVTTAMLYKNWGSGAFDPAAVTGITLNGNDSWNAATIALRPAA